MSAPRPYETDPFHPLGSILNINHLLYICEKVPVMSSMWYVQLYRYMTRMCICRTLKLMFGAIDIFEVILFSLS